MWNLVYLSNAKHTFLKCVEEIFQAELGRNIRLNKYESVCHNLHTSAHNWADQIKGNEMSNTYSMQYWSENRRLIIKWATDL